MITLSLAGMLMLGVATPQFPDQMGKSAAITEPCPSFNWTLSDDHAPLELRVYQADSSGRFDASTPLLVKALPPGTQAWTASGAACLSRGGQYVWQVSDADAAEFERAEGPFGRFEVAATPSAREFQEALRIIRDYTAHMAERDAEARALSDQAAKATSAVGMAVDGAGNVTGTSFAGNGASLTNVAAVTASRLAAAGSACASGQAPTGVDASGNAIGCTDIATQAELNAQATNADALYLGKSGGTISGNLTVSGVVSGNLNGNANTATQLSRAPTICSSGQAPRGVNANGDASGCSDVATQAELNSHKSSGDHDSRYGLKGCPSDMVAVGGWCVDRLSRGNQDNVFNGSNAQITCGNAGKSLCPLSVMQMCDSLDTLKDGLTRTCGTLTDENPARIVTSTFCGNVDSGSSFNDFTAFVNDATDSNKAVCNSGSLAEFFCCLPRGQ